MADKEEEGNIMQSSVTLHSLAYALGWLEKREAPKIDFRHADPGVYVFGGLKKVVLKKLWSSRSEEMAPKGYNLKNTNGLPVLFLSPLGKQAQGAKKAAIFMV